MTALDISCLGFRTDPPEHLEERLHTLGTYDLWFVEERLKIKELLPEDHIAPAILGFRRYVAIRILGHKGYPVPSKEVDEVWHAFILFTKDYGEFCRQVCGHFLHHVPHTSRDQKSDPPTVPYSEVYRKYFGHDDGAIGEKCAIFCGMKNSAACGCNGGVAGERGVCDSDDDCQFPIAKLPCSCMVRCKTDGG
jgi:hypothetical protein